MQKREKLLRAVYENETLAEGLWVASIFISLVSVYAALYVLVESFSESYLLAIRLAVMLAVPFLLVSLVRALVRAPRPYEVYPFYERKPHRARGKSFPSRHAFSAFAIAVAMLAFDLSFGFLLLGLSAVLCVCRFLLGIHFIRDLVAGALIGVLSSALGLWILL
ncbi:MAG: phosphatase PAP2 family protein [Clostridia bacterium]|nr:phosphatase PAP2 family protein [Clostridia bacterium]